MQIKELRGLKAVRVYQLYQQVLIAFSVVPTTRAKSIKDFLCKFENMERDQKREVLRSAIMFYNFEPDDLKNILSFALADVSMVELSEQAHAMTPESVCDAVTEVLLKCSDIQTFFWTGTEQKKSPTIQ